MTIIDDLRNVSDAALRKLAEQFSDAPRPLLAAIGAGDVAVEKLVKLRRHLEELWDASAAPSDRETGEAEGAADAETADAGTASADAGRDAVRRAGKVAMDVARRLGELAGDVPDRAQQLIADLPAKAQEVANSLSRDRLRDTLDGYTRRVADIYRELAERGGDAVRGDGETAPEYVDVAKSGPDTAAGPDAAATSAEPAESGEPITPDDNEAGHN